MIPYHWNNIDELIKTFEEINDYVVHAEEKRIQTYVETYGVFPPSHNPFDGFNINDALIFMCKEIKKLKEDAANDSINQT